MTINLGSGLKKSEQEHVFVLEYLEIIIIMASLNHQQRSNMIVSYDIGNIFAAHIRILFI